MSPEQRTWVEEAADDVVDFVAARGKPADEAIVCASGISPSGPIHLGNLREVLVAHAVAEELAHRGWLVRHLHFWDDYDRLRRVPASVPPSFERYLGRPLSDVPDPLDHCHSSYAQHFIAEFTAALERLRIHPEQIFQSVSYWKGIYAERVRRAVAARRVIAAVLAHHQTKEGTRPSTADADVDDARRAVPVRIYCGRCGRDFTDVAPGGDATSLSYRCRACGHADEVVLDDAVTAKLVWKVDWPMRWAHYGVDFEPGGVDHSSPGSSYEVGTELVAPVFGGIAPYYVGYSFVGIEGRSKLSASQGHVPTPGTALQVLEPAVLRWQYLRRRPRNGFRISFGSEVLRLYDEWDALLARIAHGQATHVERVFWRMSVRTSAGEVPATVVPLPFRSWPPRPT